MGPLKTLIEWMLLVVFLEGKQGAKRLEPNFTLHTKSTTPGQPFA